MLFAIADRIANLFQATGLALKTLRVRLMLWNVGLVLASAMACFIGVREGLRRTLTAEMDYVLTADVREISLNVADLHTTADDVTRAAVTKGKSPAAHLLESLNRKESVHEHNGWFVEILDENDRRLWASDLTPRLRPFDRPRRELIPLSWSGYRVVEQNRPAPGESPLRIRVGAPMDYIDRDMASVDAVAERGVAILLITALLAGYWLAIRAVQPLANIITTTAELRPNRMEERLPVGQTDDELDQLSRTVNQFLDRIAAYLSQSNDLLANSAHELRTPLAAIRSTVEVALGGGRTPQEYEELLNEVIDECVSLERLVNQLLLLADTDSERLRTRSEAIAFSTLVERCVEMFSAAAEARQIDLESAIQPGIEVFGFGHHLRQVVNNLLDNALKFSLPSGTVRVEVTRDPAGVAVFRVRDTGCGIRTADVPHIFDRFFRGDRSRQRIAEITGTGLGLSICQAIVASHGGQILVESEEGIGTTMTVRLPLSFGPDRPAAVREVSQPMTAAVVTQPAI
jgi:two-component system, OmpR family, heavy metal sensor histidine kinase CusS